MYQNEELFDELVEKAKAIKETLVESLRSMVTETGRRTSGSASRQRLREDVILNFLLGVHDTSFD